MSVCIMNLWKCTASREYPLWCDPMDGGSHSSIRLKVLNIFNVVFYQPENLKVDFNFPLVLHFTNSKNKKFYHYLWIHLL